MSGERFSPEQKQIAVLLSHGQKSTEEISRQLGIPYDKLVFELKEMIKLKLIELNGYPPKYRLKQNITEALKKDREIAETDSFKLKIRAIIEATALEEELLLKQLKSIESSMKKEPDFTVYETSIEKPLEDAQTKRVSSFLEAELTVRDFTALVKFMYFYGPSSVEVIKPKKLEIEISDLQDALNDMSGMIHKYNNYILELMNRKELREFHEKIYSKSAESIQENSKEESRKNQEEEK